jgi:O-antigen ligase
MAMTAELSAADRAIGRPIHGRPMIVSFRARPWSLPVRPVGALRWAVLALMVANIGRVPVLPGTGRDTSVVLNDLFITLLVFLGAMGAFARKSLKLDWVAIVALTFAAVGIASAVLGVPRFGFTPMQLALSLGYPARWLVYFGIYVFVINYVQQKDVNAVWGALETTILVMTAFGVFQAIFLPNFTQMIYAGAADTVGWDQQGHRLVSTVLEPNIMAAMIVLVLLVSLARISMGVEIALWKPVLLLGGLALTISRSGILALMVGSLVILAARGLSIKLIRFFGVVTLLIVAVLPRLIAFAAAYGKFNMGENSSAGVRLYAWAVAISTVVEHPIIGVGFNSYGYYKQATGMSAKNVSDFSSDGGLLFVAVMTGLVGLLIYSGMLAVVVHRCRSIWRNPQISASDRGLAIGVAGGVFAIIVHSLFVNAMFTTFVMEIMWLGWGLVYVIAANARREQAGVSPAAGS